VSKGRFAAMKICLRTVFCRLKTTPVNGFDVLIG
jgi:hypothetical protein